VQNGHGLSANGEGQWVDASALFLVPHLLLGGDSVRGRYRTKVGSRHPLGNCGAGAPVCQVRFLLMGAGGRSSLRLRLIQSNMSYKEGMREIIEKERPPIRAIFMGTRHTDPSCGAHPSLRLLALTERRAHHSLTS